MAPEEDQSVEPSKDAAGKPGQKQGGGGKKQGGKNKDGSNNNQQAKQKKVDKPTLKSVLTKIVPYASFPYADHALRQVGVENPNTNAEASDEHVDLLIAAANALRKMVQEMESLDEIKGFITYTQEEVKEKPSQQMIDTTGESQKAEESKGNELEQLAQEAQQKILTVDGEDIIEKFRGKILKEFLPCELLAANANDLHIDYYDFD